MNVLIVGYDSDIAKELAALHKAAGDVVFTTSRNGAGDYHLELAHPTTWPEFKETYDLIYYCIGIGDQRNSRMEVMQVNCFIALDFLSRVVRWVNADGKIVVLSTKWGSISSVAQMSKPMATANTWYKVSRAALNMGVAILSKRFQAVKWVLVHPGAVKTKSTKLLRLEGMLSPKESASAVIEASKTSNLDFQFVGFDGQPIDF